MNPTVTTEKLLTLTKSADLLRQTAEKAMRFDEAERLLTEHIRLWGRVRDALPDVNDTETAATPLVKRVVRRLGLVDSLKKELEVVGNHAICRLNVLGEIHRILGSDGGETGVSELTGVPPQLYRLPKRVEQLVADVTTWRERYDKEVAGNREARNWQEMAERHCRNEDFYRGLLDAVAIHLGKEAYTSDYGQVNDSPVRLKIPRLVAALAKQAGQCQHWRDEFVKTENELNETKARNRGLWERAGAAEKRVTELLHEKLNLEQQLGDARGTLARQDQRIGELLRENETLARNMPPEPPAEEPDKRPGIVQVMDFSTAFNTPSGVAAAATPAYKVLGQQWCRVNHENDVPPGAIADKLQGGWVVLCEVRRDITTGALTYHPLSVEDLPLVP